MAFLGALLTGVYAYRKQRLAEGDAARADAKQLFERYGAAAELLGDEAPEARLAGAYAMARLADDWTDQRQMCVDVLCSYIRLPYERDHTKSGYRRGDREVRRTIMRIIRDSLRRDDPAWRWEDINFSFEGAVFDYGDLSKAKFSGGVLNFHKAEFADRSFTFKEAQFRNTRVYFTGSEFSGATVTFENADFSAAEKVEFSAVFKSGTVSFDECEFGDHTDFTGSNVKSGGSVSFHGARGTANINLGASFTGHV
jgi:hypothetical protein